MARVQYGTIVTEIKGKNQGHVFQGGNVGFVLRSKGYTPGISSRARNQANSNLTSQASAWRDLTDSQRDAWAAIAPDWLFYNKFGQAYQGNGFQIFCSYNTNLITLTFPPVSTPGAVASPTNPNTVDWEWTNADPAFLVLGNTPVSYDAIAVFAAAPASAGRNSNHARYRLLFAGGIDGIEDFSLQSDYEAIFPAPQMGQRITIKAIFYNLNFPYPFYPSIRSTIRTA